MDSVGQPLTTSVSAFGLAFLLLMGALVLAVPRKYATLPIVALACFMTMGERVVIGGLNFTMIRMLLAFGWMRVILRQEIFRTRLQPVDKYILAWVVLRTINYTIVWGGSSALINRLGYAYDILGSYFLLRALIREPNDLYRAIRFLAVCVGPLAALMLMEKLSGANPFAALGGVRFSEVRDGVIRAQGPFAHSILAGTFAAVSFPLFVGLAWYRRSGKILAVWGTLGSALIAVVSGSSGPVLAMLTALAAIMLWPARRCMHIFRWAFLIVVLALHLLMSSPVWFLAARLTVFSGSTGWYRGFLIDQTMRHFSEWWFVGSNAAANWHFYLGDLTNQYLLEGLSGGLVTMLLFIAVIWSSFKSIGRALHLPGSDLRFKRFSWCMGAALAAHAVSFMSVSYFDQTIIMFYLLLAGIAALSVSPAMVPFQPAAVYAETQAPRSSELVPQV
jgi:hypothetical protein